MGGEEGMVVGEEGTMVGEDGEWDNNNDNNNNFNIPSSVTLGMASVLIGAAGAFADLIVPTPNLSMPKKVLGLKMPPLHIDDNFVIPIVTGFCASLVCKWLEIDEEVKFKKFLLL